MVQLKPSPSIITQPKPRYGHLSKIDPQFEPHQEAIDKRFTALWSLPLEDLKAAYRTAPVALPEGAPQAGKEYQVLDHDIPTRDGAMIGLRVYSPIKAKENAILVLKAHGGGISLPRFALRLTFAYIFNIGWVVGSHQVEEVENRMLAAYGGAVVASVDYRLAPEYKFPYAANDCFDALRWASPAKTPVLTKTSDNSQCKSNASALGINPDAIVVAGGSAGGNIVRHIYDIKRKA